jgi:aspartate 1-decarboxylase
MTIYMLKSKVHRARITDANANYEGSLTLSEDLMEAVGFQPYEKILVGNINNGNRFETYLIAGKRGTGEVCLNGGTAHLGNVGELVTIMSFAGLNEDEAVRHEPRVVTLEQGNKLPEKQS